MQQASRVLLGPQRLARTLGRAVADVGIAGRIAAVTAGWEEREHEDQELREHLGGRTMNLHLYQRAEDVFQRDPELLDALRRRYDRMRELRDVYRLRLSYVLEAARELLRSDGDPSLLEPERADAIDTVRRLDAQHLGRVCEALEEFDARWRPRERDHVARHRRELVEILGECEALCVAGGHVGVLFNRLRLFGVLELWGNRPIFAWSAGAMALAQSIVLFHDSPPQGPGNAEILGPGLGVCTGVVPLPHARRRLRVQDTTRVGLFARRFGPSLCAVLDENTRLTWDGQQWAGEPGTLRLCTDGTLAEVGVA